ncbi:MAG: Tex family protein [Flavobacteriales bacterium]
MNRILDRITQETSLNPNQVNGIIRLLNEGCTLPFIARYRKEVTDNADEVQIATVQKKLLYYRELTERKTVVLKTIEEQGKLTADLSEKITECYDSKELEDLYLPYKPRRKTKADTARELGLEPLTKQIMVQNSGNVAALAQRYVNKDVHTAEEAIEGALHIVAEWISLHVGARNFCRRKLFHEGILHSKAVKGKEQEADQYKDYYDYKEAVKRIKSHRTLALFRGEKEGVLRLQLKPGDEKNIILELERFFVKNNTDASEYVSKAVKDAYKRLIEPSIESEIREELKQKADEEAIHVFAQNLRQLLMGAPLGEKRILAIDPGYRSGCKIVCLDSNGDLLHNETIYPHAPENKSSEAAKKLCSLIQSHKIEAIAIGNGTASRETESLVRRIAMPRPVEVYLVSEAGASIYSASEVGRKEFPQYDVTVRGAVSIGRRLMDPLAELVKIDPKNIGVGQYQHDVNQNLLKDSLTQVVESCVNTVGINLNTASKYLLTYVSGIGPALAENIIEYRKENGGFANRKQLLKVPKLGPKAFEQSAGFLRITDGENPLDNSAVHPESYSVVEQIAKLSNISVGELIGNKEKLSAIEAEGKVLNFAGQFTLKDILAELARPGRDPRKKTKILEFDKQIKTIKDITPGMQLPGIVTNITNFGAFVDIGIKTQGLVHISQLSDSFVQDPYDVVSLHQHVKVKVLEVDPVRNRLSLSMKSEP